MGWWANEMSDCQDARSAQTSRRKEAGYHNHYYDLYDSPSHCDAHYNHNLYDGANDPTGLRSFNRRFCPTTNDGGDGSYAAYAAHVFCSSSKLWRLSTNGAAYDATTNGTAYDATANGTANHSPLFPSPYQYPTYDAATASDDDAAATDDDATAHVQ